jgi:PKD repeat protein
MLKRLTATLLLTLGTGLLAACGGRATTEQVFHPATPAPQEPAAQLPSPPADRQTAGLTETVVLGRLPDIRSTGAQDQGSALQLNAAPAGVEYALYRFNPGANAPDSVSVLLDDGVTTGAYIGLADYATGRWDFQGPFTAQKSFVVDDGAHLSPGGNLWVAVIAAQGQQATVEALSVRTINPANQPPTAALDSDISTSTSVPLPVHFDASLSSDSDGQLIEYAWDWESDGIYDGFTDGPLATHTFTEPGNHLVTLRVTDDQFGRSTATKLIDLGNAPPVVAIGVTPGTDGAPGDLVELDASGSADSDGTISSLDWDLDGDSTFEVVNQNHISAHQLPSTPGRQVVTVRATDNEGATAMASVTLTAHGWSAPVNAEIGVGQVTNLLLVDGCPAIAYRYYINFGGPPNPEIGELHYVRAIDPEGSAWDDPVLLDASGPILDLSMTVVGGRPAIAYGVDLDNNFFTKDYELRYVRASNTDGTAWNAPLTVDNSTNLVGEGCSMAVVDGLPAIAYREGTVGELRYIRAQTPTGSYWGMPTQIDTLLGTGLGPSMAVISGKPMVACYTAAPSALRFVAALDAHGDTWDTAQTLDSNGGVGNTGIDPSLTDFYGLAAVAYRDQQHNSLKFMHANDQAGTNWPTLPQLIDGTDDAGYAPSLEMINGELAVSYKTDTGATYNLMYAHSTTSGLTWQTEGVDVNNVRGDYSSLLELDGRPAISYFGVLSNVIHFTQLY